MYEFKNPLGDRRIYKPVYAPVYELLAGFKNILAADNIKTLVRPQYLVDLSGVYVVVRTITPRVLLTGRFPVIHIRRNS